MGKGIFIQIRFPRVGNFIVNKAVDFAMQRKNLSIVSHGNECVTHQRCRNIERINGTRIEEHIIDNGVRSRYKIIAANPGISFQPGRNCQGIAGIDKFEEGIGDQVWVNIDDMFRIVSLQPAVKSGKEADIRRNNGEAEPCIGI